MATIQGRPGKIKGAAIEIKGIIEEFQMQALAGGTAAWELWEHALLPRIRTKMVEKIQGNYKKKKQKDGLATAKKKSRLRPTV